MSPEEALVAALSSCHMLWFLAIAAKRGFVVDSYRDEAAGVMGRRPAVDPATAPEGTKWCPECGKFLPVECFARNRGRRSGRQTYCRPHHNARLKAQRDKRTAADRARIIANRRAARAAREAGQPVRPPGRPRKDAA